MSGPPNGSPLRLVKSPGRPLALDSFTVQLPPSVAVDLRAGGFQHVPRFDVSTGELVRESWQAPAAGHGLNGFQVSGPGVGLQVSGSAKVLAENYPGGITLARVPQLADAIRATGICPELTAEDLLEADVQSVDPTGAVHVGAANVARHLRAFGMLEASPGFDVQTYDREGISLNRTRRGGRDRLIIYDKGRELTGTAAGRAFLADVSPAVAEWATGTLRVERHARRLSPVRRCAGRERGRVSLAELFDTPRNPVADLYDEAAAPLSAPVVADDFLGYVRAGLSPGKVAGRMGRDRLLAALDFDLDRVEALLKEADAIRGGHRNAGREMRHYREAAAARFAARNGPGEAAALHALVLDFGRRLRAA